MRSGSPLVATEEPVRQGTHEVPPYVTDRTGPRFPPRRRLSVAGRAHLAVADDHAHALFALHAALSRSAHPDGLVAANAAIGAKIASAIIVFLMVSSCSKWIVIGTLLAKTSIVASGSASVPVARPG